MRREKGPVVCFIELGSLLFFAILPRLGLFVPLFYFVLARIFSRVSPFLSPFPPFSSLSSSCVIFRALSRKLQSMPRRRAMECICVLVDSTALLPSPFLHKPLFSLFSISSSLFTLRLGCSLRSMWYRRRVSLFFPHSLYLFARPPRCLVYHAPFSRLIKRPSLEFSCVTWPIFISPIFVNIRAYIPPC